MTGINYITKIEITIFHDTKWETEGLDDVLVNVVRKWDLLLTPSIYQAKPKPIDSETKKIAEAWLLLS